MFYSIKGKLNYIDSAYVVVETGGIGFKLITTLTTISRVGQIGSEVELYTYLHVREDTMDLYGFYEKIEEKCFKLLISVTGVGPKAGIAILSALNPEYLIRAVLEGNFKSIQQAPGIGPKISQRIVIELKDKMKKLSAEKGFVTEINSGLGEQRVSSINEAIEALMSLGYSHGEATTALSGVDGSKSTEELIKIGLLDLAR